MVKLFRMFLLSVALLLTFAVQAQVYVGDYTTTTSTGSFISIASWGTQLTDLETDDAAVSVPLPFNFMFGDEECTSIMVSSNGQIGIGTANPALSGYNEHTGDMSIIVPLGHDLNLDTSSYGGGHVYYDVQGVSPNRYMTIEYDHVRPYSTSGSTNCYSFQVFLYETGDIEFVYDTCTAPTSQQAYVFLREHGVGSALAVVGSWANISTSHTISAIGLSTANRPTPGLVISFARPTTSCPRPLNFACLSASRADSIVFAWNTAPETYQWELRYDTIGTHVDSMQHVFSYISDSVFVCNSMLAGGRYDVYLRTDCGGEQSLWVGPITVIPGAYTMPATGSNIIYACGGVIYDDGGPTGNYSNSCNSTLIIRPSHPDSLVAISGTLNTESCCDHLYIYDGEGTSGTLLYQGQGNVTVPRTSSTSGSLTIHFSSDPSFVYGGFELSVSCTRAPQCRTIGNVEVSNVAGASAWLNWSLRGNTDAPAYFIVRAVNLDDTTASDIIDSTSNLNYLFTGLEPTTNYRAVVYSICNRDTVLGDSVDFLTRCLVGGVTSLSGTGTSQTSGVPVNSSWGNTFCQSIYTAAELTAMGLTPGAIRGVTYNWASAGSYQKELVIFMGQTINTAYSSYSPLTGSMTQVYSGLRNTTDVGTIEYYFTTPFVWDGVSNIVLSSFVNQPAGVSHSSSGFYGYSTNCGATRSIYSYKDGTAYTASTLNTGSTYTSSYRPNVSFIKPCDTLATCVAPNVIVTDVQPYETSIIWAPGYQESSWDVYHKLGGADTWTLDASNVSDAHYTFTALQPMNVYEVKIVPNCGDDSVFGMAEFVTPCVPLMTLPFNEDFENFTASSTSGSPITECWHRGTNYSSSSYPYLSTSYAHSGSKSMYFYNPGSTYYDYLALPAIGIAMDSVQVSFAAYKTSDYQIQVGVMTDPEDFSTFTQVATVSPSSTNTWQMFEISFANYTGEGQYIALAGNQATSIMYIDDIQVDYISSCPRPQNVTATNTTTNTATLHWSDDSTNYFEIEYGPVGFTRGTGDLVTSSADSVTLYGLNHSTRYAVYVRGLCGSDSSNWSFVSYFVTDCGIIDSLPYGFNFGSWGTGTTARPACWACGGYSSYPYITSVSDATGRPATPLYMYSYTSNRVYASMPFLDSISYPIQMTQAIFRAWTTSTVSTSYSHSLIVGVCSTQGDLATFTAVDTVELTPVPELYEVAFNPAIGAGQYVTFISTATGGASYNYVYLDSVAIELIPDCQSPFHLMASNLTATTAVLSWTERNTANEWQIEYGPHGFVLGTGTRIAVSANPYTLTGLSSSSSYDYYVRSACDVNEFSEWSRTPCFFTTLQNPGTVPYFCDFESGTEWDNWQTSSNVPVNWYRGTAVGNGSVGMDNNGTQAMYISADTGRTCSTDMAAVVNATAYRDIDFGPADSSFLLSFRAAAGGTTTAGYDGLMVFIVDPSAPVVASSNNITTPWGSVNDLTYLTFMRCSSSWNTYTAILDTLSGVHRLAFFWFNQATGTDDFVGLPAAVDDVSIQYIGCPRPAGVRASNISMTTATIEWGGSEYGDYRVILRSSTGNTVATELVHTNSIHFTGLASSSTYSCYVRRVCGDSDSSQLVPFTFRTKLCSEGYTDSVGDFSATTTSYYVPVNNYYGYTYTQQIVPASEMEGFGNISAINFYYSGASPMTSKTACSIYMGHTTLSSFSDADSPIDPDSLRLVYTGSLNCQPGWNMFELNSPYEYDGERNLVIAIDDNSGNYNGTAYTFDVCQTPNITTICYYSDGTNPNPASLSQLTSFTGTRTSFAYRVKMSFEVCPPSSCARPILRDPIVRRNGVTFRWRNTGSAYDVSYRRASSSSWTVESFSTQDTFYVTPTLTPMTDYVYRVRQYCDSTGVSDWATGEFNSSDLPCLPPMDLHLTNVTNKKASFAWTPEENNIRYKVHVFNSYFDRTVTSYIASATVTGLDPSMTYYACILSVCQDYEDPSYWSDTIAFSTDFCPDVTNVRATDVQGNTAVIDWDEGGRAEEWEVQYGPLGFPQGDGISVITNSHPITLTGLIGESQYDVYVRAICGDGFQSEHWVGTNITTPYSSITSVTDDSRVRLFPNPTSADVELSLPAVSSSVRVEVIDMSGRNVLGYTLPAGTERFTVAASQLSQGAYYVRVIGGELNTVKKLIVR